MSLDNRLAKLEERHSALDAEISSAFAANPAMSESELKTMKRKKLQLKEEIERLRPH